LAKYNLQYVDGQIQPKDGYEFVDPYSSNYAVKVKGAVDTPASSEAVDT